MKIVDFHCDTISQLYDLKQSGENINLKEKEVFINVKLIYDLINSIIHRIHN